MKETILMVKDRKLIEIPRDTWEQHLTRAAHDDANVLGFMTEEHHQVRYFVVKELPRFGKPIPPEAISGALNIPLSETIQILDDLEKHLFFLVRNEKGEVVWAFPVTAENTPHRLTFSTGERFNAA